VTIIPILNIITSRLSNWNCKFFSFGGCLILLRSVLSSLSVYFISFFKAATCIISSIESLFNFFFGVVVRVSERSLGLTGTLFTEGGGGFRS